MAFGVALIVVVLLGWAVMARKLAPMANTARDHFDVILVLGTPADSDGNPTPDQLARVTEGVREYERGVASHIVFTGGASHNEFVEADVMARVAAAQGIPPSAIFVETKSSDTIQNACYSARLLRNHGWRSAEVISSGLHLPRVSMIFSRTSLEWRLRSAAPLEPGDGTSAGMKLFEILKTIRYLVYANWAERCDSETE